MWFFIFAFLHASVTYSMNLKPTAALIANPNSLDFGNVEVGTSSGSSLIALKNIGSLAAVISVVSTINPNGTPTPIMQLSDNNCSPLTVLPQGSCTFKVTFVPAASGVFSGLVRVVYLPESVTPQQPKTLDIPVTGFGITLVSLSVTPNRVRVERNASIKAEGTYSDGNVRDVSSLVQWSVGDSSILSVSSPELKIKGLATGQTNLTASRFGVQGSSNVTVYSLISKFKPGLLVIQDPVIMGDHFYFIGGVYGDSRLWKSDGTPEGTVMVHDTIVPNNSPVWDKDRWSYLVVKDNYIYFLSWDRDYLYRTDGTAAGTVIVKEIQRGGNCNPDGIVKVGETMYFGGLVYPPGICAIWKSDGTSQGTYGTPVSVTAMHSLGGVDDTLFFWGKNTNTGYELWKSNGTPDGSGFVKDIYPGTETSRPFFTGMTGFESLFYFAAKHPVTGFDLWRTDGTNVGTIIVKDNPAGAMPGSLQEYKGALYFVQNEKVWKTDGTEAGTSQISDNSGRYFGLRRLGEQLYAPLSTTVSTGNIAIYDGEQFTKVPISSGQWNYFFAGAGKRFYFGTKYSNFGKELWESDGVTAELVQDYVKGGPDTSQDPNGLSPETLFWFKGNLYFSGLETDNESFYNRSLYKLTPEIP